MVFAHQDAMLSMTGYGTGQRQSEEFRVAVEVRTVNHRFLDPHIRLPREYQFLENDIQRALRAAIRRGRVDMTVSVQSLVAPECVVDSAAAGAYVAAAAKLRQELGFSDALDLKTLLGLPGVVQGTDSRSALAQPPDGLNALVLLCVREALEGVGRMRLLEGNALQAEMARYVGSIRDKTARMRPLAEASVNEYKVRLEERLTLLLSQAPVDPQRLAQEVAIMAERSDFSEELARLESHLDQFSALLEGSEVGKKMDFLLQEMQREANTILSKCGSLEIARQGIAIKADIEKLREQAQNVE